MSHSLTDPDLLALLSDTLNGVAAPAGAAGAVICTCREFATGFQQAAQAHPGLVFRWVDVEDESAAVGDLDVETFPTLVIGAADGGVRFAGPVLPQAAQIPRLLKSLGL